MATSLTISILADVAKAVQGIDSIDKKTTAMGEGMKRVGTTIAGAFSFSQIEGWVKGWIDAGMQAKGAAKNVGIVFGQSAEQVKAWADETSIHFGMTAAEAEQAAAKVGTALKGYGMSAADAATASEALVQRSADVAKVMGVDQAEVLAKVETAMRGRTAGLKDYGVEVEKGASATQVLNAFMEQTAGTAGRADTSMGQFHATMGNLSEQLGQVLVPIVLTFMPLLQMLANFARSNKVAFDAVVIVLVILASAFAAAAVAAGVFGVTTAAVLWPITAIVAGIAALVAIIVVVCANWSTLVGWMHTAASAVMDFVGRFQILLLIFGGPLGAALVALKHFSDIWGGIKAAIGGVEAAIHAVTGALDKMWGVAQKVGNFLSHIPGVNLTGHVAGAPAPGVSSYGVSAAAPVVFSPTITLTGDVGDPVLAGRRIVNALEAWTQANGRRRIAALVGP